MANSDYVRRGAGLICPVAYLLGALTPLAVLGYITGYRSQDGSLPAVGTAAMINGEIVKVTAVALDQITIQRGCADTIPQSHPSNSAVWFIDGRVGYANREYMATETIGVKLLMKTTGGAMEAKNSPPNALTFNSRFARPYAPGLVLVNGDPFPVTQTIDSTDSDLALSWAHRDRISQADQLIDHSVGNVGPEVGTTYTLRLFKGDEVSPRLTIAGIETNAYTISLFDLVSALDLSDEEDQPAHFTLCSVRDTFESWQAYRINFLVDASSIELGWGNSWGLAYGG